MVEETPSSTHPPLPPTTEDDRLDRLRLLRSRRVGVSTWYRLMAEHDGDAAAALAALPGLARDAGVEDYAPCSVEAARRECAAARRAGLSPLFRGEAAYPADLARLPDAPPLLYAMGARALLDRPLVALVGARNASSLGTRMAQRLAAGLGAAGFVVVSGLARGVDAAAHRGALESGTIAVHAGGADIVYPAENAGLADEIARTGLRLSEMPPGLQPRARHFPARNRIVSGLCRAVVVVEAAARSGSLITARTALDQGREVLAVPGHPMDGRAEGCNMLLRDGATLVRGAEDVIEIVGAPGESPAFGDPAVPADTIPPAADPRPLRDIAALHGRILERLGPSPVAEDQLLRDLPGEAGRIGPALTDLELAGRILRQPGGLVSRTR